MPVIQSLRRAHPCLDASDRRFHHPLVNILSLIKIIDFEVDETENIYMSSAMKIFPYLAYTFTSRVYPGGTFLGEDQAYGAKKGMYRFLFSGKNLAWPPGSGDIVLTRTDKGPAPPYRPLRLEEIAITAGLPTDRFTRIEEAADLINRCGSFLTVRQDIASFIHLSAKDYFTAGKGKQIFDGALVEKGRIARRLLDAMNSTLRRDMCNLRKPGARIQEATGQIKGSILPQITYVREYWINHFSACPQDYGDILSDDSKAHRFLLEHLLHWLEAMSVTGQAYVRGCAIVHKYTARARKTRGSCSENFVALRSTGFSSLFFLSWL